MRRAIMTVLVTLVAAACGGGESTDSTTVAPATTIAASTTSDASTTTSAPESTTTTTETTTTAVAERPAAPAVSPLVITSVDFDEEYAVITNVTGSGYSLEGHFICNFPTYAPIGELGTIPAGESFTVELATIAASTGSGEIGIYTTNDFSNPDAMVTYVEWGTPGHARSGVAVAAGLWTEGDFVDNGHASFRAMTSGGSGDDYELVE